MKNNRYLKELGYTWRDLPGNYDKRLAKEGETCAAADCRNAEDNEGFCGYEFFSLDHSLALYIYPRLCYFRDYIMDIGTPGCFTCSSYTTKNKDEITKAGQEMWHQIVNDMCEAFRLILTLEDREGWSGIDQQKINKGLHLFAEYYHCLWY